jgi:hypothetical protein
MDKLNRYEIKHTSGQLWDDGEIYPSAYGSFLEKVYLWILQFIFGEL